MTNKPTIRAATAADHDAWLPLWRGYQAFYKVSLPEATTRTTWQRLLDAAEPMYLALAELGGRVVGMVHFIEHVRAQAAAMGCAKVHWLTHESNAEAMVLYNKIAERPGFVQYRRNL